MLIGGKVLDASAVAAWSSGGNAYPRIGADAITGLQARLSHLSHLDDVIGSGKLRDVAVAELRLLTGLLTDTTHTADTEQQLDSLAAQASRLCGWLHYDSGRHAAAQRYSLTALRASATAGDRSHSRHRELGRELLSDALQRAERAPCRRVPPLHRQSGSRWKSTRVARYGS